MTVSPRYAAYEDVVDTGVVVPVQVPSSTRLRIAADGKRKGLQLGTETMWNRNSGDHIRYYKCKKDGVDRVIFHPSKS